MKNARDLILACAIVETILAVPFIGAGVIISLAYIPLVAALVLHIISLIQCINEKLPKYGNITGLVTSVVGMVPLLGFIMHVTSAAMLWIIYNKIKDKQTTIDITPK
ncbi:MAG: hypothetical protein HQL27_02995 [Candidatus Omnitrophica bacterium]|nr:hypothetical protein [Candidatus Omnitrophota bacterium]